jgi:hypothetical protein
VSAVQVDTGEFRALAAEVADLRQGLQHLRVALISNAMTRAAFDGMAEAEGRRAGGRRRRPSHLRLVGGERRPS